MDNLTHSLVGLLVAKTGLERQAPLAVPAAIIAANAPDLDLIASLGGRWSYLAHHRGGSHSIIGVVAISLAVAGIFWLIERFWARRENRAPRGSLRGLAFLSLLAGFTHPLLDWTNNYGVRPFLPFNDRWYYGDLVFVFDPWLWLVLAGTAFFVTATSRLRILVWLGIGALLTALMVVGYNLSLPSKRAPAQFGTLLLWLVGIMVVVVIYRFRARLPSCRWLAFAALCFLPLYWSGLAWIRAGVRSEVVPVAEGYANSDGEHLRRLALMPTFGDPWRWQGLADTDGAVYRLTYLPLDSPDLRTSGERFPGPEGLQRRLVDEAKKDPRVKIFMDFSRFPLARVDPLCTDKTIVRFVDMRYTEPSTGGAPFSVDVPVNCVALSGP